MSVYELRSAFPLSNAEIVAGQERWICRLAEVSDLRPESDRLSWYLVFEREGLSHNPEHFRKLEIVTTADATLANGWLHDTRRRLTEWLRSAEQDGRLEWLETYEV